jgi:hypothetical protein
MDAAMLLVCFQSRETLIKQVSVAQCTELDTKMQRLGTLISGTVNLMYRN